MDVLMADQDAFRALMGAPDSTDAKKIMTFVRGE